MGNPVDEFRFAPELFETRTAVIEALHARGFDWLSHYSVVDVLHDVYGIEVCGIVEQSVANRILRILKGMFPHWSFERLYLKDYGREPGWKAIVQRDADPPAEHWETAG
jgi:hypothetical protein